VVIFHEVWGLVPHFADVCKRIGKLGFAATAPNLYTGHTEILTPPNIQAAMGAVWNLSLEERRDKAKVERELARKKADQRVREVVALLYDQSFRDTLLSRAMAAVNEARTEFANISTLGFCLGGGLSLNVAARSEGITSAISFYGEPPNNTDTQRITAPVLAILASQDEIINQKVPAFVEGALKGGKDLTLRIYPGTKHGFFNDTRKAVYNRDASHEAWELTKFFLAGTLGQH